MRKKILLAAATVMAMAFMAPGSPAQQLTGRTGNIVEYFGKEKITSTSEGSILHTFRNGYLLPVAPSVGTLFNGQDIVGWMYATGNFQAPADGSKLEWSYPVDPEMDAAQMLRRGRMTSEQIAQLKPAWTWSAISADDTTDVFSSPEMRWAYLYTAYDSPREQIVLLDATGGTRTFINGMPHEGDHYDFGYTLIPVKLKKGKNEFIYTSGRFGRVASKLVVPGKPVMFTNRDMTLPSIIIGENDNKWAAVRVINASDKEMKGMSIETQLSSGESVKYATDDIMPMSVRKVKFQVPATRGTQEGPVKATLILRDSKDKEIDRTEMDIHQRPGNKHHERTFISNIDGSVQYYSVAPSTTPGEGQAFVLSVHGAAVEAASQSRAYAQKDWTYVVAPTNRRPFGFNWEDWGRIDALEVLETGKKLFKTDPERTYLTGHSMGGHGSWYLGTTYPDKFAAVAPCASYPDIASYGRRTADNLHSKNPYYEEIARAANPGRVVTMIRNLLQSGVYVFHGDADDVVSIEPIRDMRALLGTFHHDFCYYEYPGGTHWFGNESVDWKPIFEFFSRHKIPANKNVKTLEFHTASPVISPSDHWIRIEQQERPYDFTTIKASVKNDTLTVDEAKNVTFLTLDIPSLELGGSVVVSIGGKNITVPADKPANLRLASDGWELAGNIDSKEKNSLRGGGFKQAFDNNVVLVYATGGTKAENEWYMNRARFDAETFYYRANSSIDVIADRDFRLADYAGRNVVLYGNASNNSAWNLLLANAPFRVGNGRIDWGGKQFSGDNLGVYLIYPRHDSPTASVGVVAGTGEKGMRTIYANNYISGITGFPDYMIFRDDLLLSGMSGMETAGFFDNNWKIAE